MKRVCVRCVYVCVCVMCERRVRVCELGACEVCMCVCEVCVCVCELCVCVCVKGVCACV